MVFSKEEGILLAFYQRANEVIKMYSEGFQLFFKLYVLDVWSLVERLLKKVLFPYFFFMLLSYHFGSGLSNCWSNSFWCLQQLFNYISFLFKYIMNNFVHKKHFLVEILFVHLCIDPKHGLRSMVFSACINKLKRKI